MVLDKTTSHSGSVLKKIPRIFLGIFSFILIAGSFLIRGGVDDGQKALIAPPENLHRLTFGYNEATSDVFWIRTIQDLDYCDQQLSEKICHNNSWLYKMLEAITTMSPSFRMPYAAGSLALTVIISDIEGATKIFDKGIAAFPNDWPILYRGAYHYLYELDNKTRAAELLVRAAKAGAPPFTMALAGRLYSDEGKLDLAEALLQEMKATEQDPRLIQRLETKIQETRAKK